jgi:hypothetical protein
MLQLNLKKKDRIKDRFAPIKLKVDKQVKAVTQALRFKNLQ